MVTAMYGEKKLTNATNLHAGTGKSTKGSLGTGAGRLRLHATGSTKLNVQGSDTKGLATLGDILGGHHSGVWRRFVTIGLYLHATSHTNDSFTARNICDVL